MSVPPHQTSQNELRCMMHIAWRWGQREEVKENIFPCYLISLDLHQLFSWSKPEKRKGGYWLALGGKHTDQVHCIRCHPLLPPSVHLQVHHADLPSSWAPFPATACWAVLTSPAAFQKHMASCTSGRLLMIVLMHSLPSEYQFQSREGKYDWPLSFQLKVRKHI